MCVISPVVLNGFQPTPKKQNRPYARPALEPGLSAALASHETKHRPPPAYYEALLTPDPWPRAVYMYFAR